MYSRSLLDVGKNSNVDAPALAPIAHAHARNKATAVAAPNWAAARSVQKDVLPQILIDVCKTILIHRQKTRLANVKSRLQALCRAERAQLACDFARLCSFIWKFCSHKS